MTSKQRHLPLLLAALFLAACGSNGERNFELDGDADGDGIPNDVEGLVDYTDTDGDTIPDFQDTDSDGDGLEDSWEAGETPANPRDSDSDGTPDYRDEDSDGNGFPDSREGKGDADGDGLPDAIDPDDDEDGIDDIDELGGRTEFPRDTDGDGMPDFRDPDSDGDSIIDGHEWGPDTDDDGLRDVEDLDSDGDGLTDAQEAGDDDLSTRPVDTDMDGAPDFRDLDSDADGIADVDEDEYGTSPVESDTDGDGVSDLIESVAGTDPTDATEDPRGEGDFVFVVPYREEPDPPQDTLRFKTNIQFADVYFMFDVTGSMDDVIAALRDATVRIIDDLTCESFTEPCTADDDCSTGRICGSEGQCIEDPRLDGCIASLWTGAAKYQDPGTFQNLVSIQPDPATTQALIPGDTDAGGNEALFESVACVADPSVCGPRASCSPFGIGCPGYRDEAIKILVGVTDEDDQCPAGECTVSTAMAAGLALRPEDITFVGVDADEGRMPETDLKGIANASGSVTSSGDPLYFAGTPSEIEASVAMALREIASNVPLFVDINVTDEPDDDGDALQFIERVSVNTEADGCTDAPTTNLDGDEYDDAFPSLLPGTAVCWDVVVRENRRVEPTPMPQVFRAKLQVRGDGSPLDERTVFFLVPPEIPEPGLE